jgi:hypothetical protein
VGASNGPCTYTCFGANSLAERYFPGEQDATRCWTYDPATGAWPESDSATPGVDGTGTDLLEMRQDRLLWMPIMAETALASAGQDAAFTVGAGRVCTNVTFQTSTFAPEAFTADSNTDEATAASAPLANQALTLAEEVRCLFEGQHEHFHDVDEVHAVEVVGYVHSGLHETAGGVTGFTVGDCEEITIEVNTASAATTIEWELDDGGHNGPWSFTSPAGTGNYEHVLCAYDNNFTLTKSDGWQGTVKVNRYVPDKTIRIDTLTREPADGAWCAANPAHCSDNGVQTRNWIIHGTSLNGIPSTLDARLQSGDIAIDPADYALSFANIVLRYVRFTDQEATLDPFKAQVCVAAKRLLLSQPRRLAPAHVAA